ncbi:carbohydrate sulfotransferase 12-like [Physeter macrocephalus]|uniref:Carbohydrate sulfotransferase 12-like n=1 Tax=Physeter macrocephalus TaxID=9755 RepID=A0A9W2X2R8_PHYMC|nr:carbohydrate sulfotransferase 12-like [Physeter catodon]
MDTMTKSRFFRLWLVLGSVFMILLIIVYWDNMGTAHFYLHASLSRPHILERFPSAKPGDEKYFTASIEEMLEKLLSAHAKQNSLLGKKAEQPSPPASSRPVLSNMEESVRGYDWSMPAVIEVLLPQRAASSLCGKLK